MSSGNADSWRPYSIFPTENIPKSVMLSHIDDSIPTEEEYEWVVRRIRGIKSRAPSPMRA